MPTYLLIIIAILGWGTAPLFHKVANTNMHPFVSAAVITTVYAIITPFYFVFFKFDTKTNLTGIICAVLGALCMLIGSTAYFFTLRNVEAGRVAAMTGLYPVITFILSSIFLGEDFTIKKIIGIFFAIISLFFLSSK